VRGKMSKCPKCGSSNVHLALCVCFDCRHQWKNKYKPRKKTVFHKITQSPEVLAEKFVYYLRYGNCYASSIISDVFKSREEALAATVEKLKEVCDAEGN
jgi:hypothetical protein